MQFVQRQLRAQEFWADLLVAGLFSSAFLLVMRPSHHTTVQGLSERRFHVGQTAHFLHGADLDVECHHKQHQPLVNQLLCKYPGVDADMLQGYSAEKLSGAQLQIMHDRTAQHDFRDKKTALQSM